MGVSIYLSVLRVRKRLRGICSLGKTMLNVVLVCLHRPVKQPAYLQGEQFRVCACVCSISGFFQVIPTRAVVIRELSNLSLENTCYHIFSDKKKGHYQQLTRRLIFTVI